MYKSLPKNNLPIKKLFIDKNIADLEIIDSLTSNISIVPEIITDAGAVYDYVLSNVKSYSHHGGLPITTNHEGLCNTASYGDLHINNDKDKNNDAVQRGKETLFLTRNQGAFIRKCPGTSHYRCCDYTILHIGTFCNMDCSYCILQAYFHPPVMQFFVNHNTLFAELDAIFKENKIYRIGTGEFTDSMIWENLMDFSKILITKFAKQKNAILELKTKTVNINNLKNLDHNGKTILAWSLNTDRIINSEERGTASLNARLKAASKCESWGYKLAFHFDPMIIYDQCEKEYLNVIDRLFASVSPDNIVWISIGTFRFMPALKQIIEKRFLDSKIIYGEFIQGIDGKMRYFKPLRIALYQKIISYIKKLAPNLVVYFCMEDDEVWQKTLGFTLSESNGLGKMLDESAVKHCNLNN